MSRNIAVEQILEKVDFPIDAKGIRNKDKHIRKHICHYKTS